MVEDTSEALANAATNISAFASLVNSKSFNVDDGFGFAPFIFDADTMRCVANGRDATGFSNLTLEEMAAALGVSTVQDGLSDEILAASAAESDGWFKFNFVSEDYPDEPISFLGYAKGVDAFGHSYVVLAGLAHRLLPRMDIDACPTSVNRRCNIQNVRSLVGAVLYSAMAAETPAELREVWNEITFPRDNTYRDGSWYIFAFGFGDDFTSGAFAHTRSDWIRQTLYEISLLFVPDLTKQNGTVLHEQFRDAALGGGGWAKYDWTVSSTAAAQVKVSYVTGVKLFGNDYYFGAGFNHIRDPAAASSLCSTCSVEYSESCAIGNVLTLSAHAEVDVLTRIEANNLFVDINNATSEEFVMPGGFGVLIVDYASKTVMADTVDASRVGGGVAAAFAARRIGEVDASHENLKAKANAGGGWVELPGEEGFSNFVAFVNKISKDNKEYYLVGGYRRERAPVVEACSAAYSAPCSETNARALIGEIVTSIQLASSDAEMTSILGEINAGSVLVAPDFFPIVLDSDFNLVAHGDAAVHEAWNVSDPHLYTEFVQQVEAVSSLGNSFEADLRLNAFKVGGGAFKVSWNDAFGTSMEKIVVVQAARQVSVDDGNVETYYVLIMYVDAPAPALCADGCPANAYCTEANSIDGVPARCECGFYFTPMYSYTSNETCDSTFTHDMVMSCAVDEEKEGIGSVKSIARVLASMNCVFAFFCIVWTGLMRKHIIVKASQPALLVLVGVGTIVSSTTIFVMAIDDSEGPAAGDGYNDAANWACMAQPWFYGLGFAITYCSMIVKLQRVAKVFKNAAKMRKSRGVSLRRTLVSLAGLVCVELLILIIWSVTDPLKFVRPTLNPLNGACESPSSRMFITLVAVYHLSLLFYGAYLSYKCRKMNGVFAETKYLSLAMLGNLQVLLLALPVIVLTADDAETSMFIRAIAIFLNDFSTTALIFCPKMYFAVFGAPETSGAGGNVLTKASKASRGNGPTGSSVVGSTKVATTKGSTVVE
ncbi:Metabotropic glutamate receptor-like protein E [Hondaea fermentalgiana]|uniref:Metabotropic glutamate receptor-like protein E n=1 Tax=Hondaea fermentalgiana TaxID=2315210 RepID=A0A2R5GWF7_9STRA|nr:Metabotropic glutamate receptor-like protein E [Hondaea fermentalgiana]|eukprot:GBG32274.1 Metabotropic glutamate receptor-like protein E [Hondaea fermentalgiana]